ncbi:hypothetical protein ACFC06_12195 [Nocardia sp. NPDC056064]|uniref:hypothetical protein n=1 Tax=Nocardia sp. NPDC056064 TaxID=3345701 RepID=UPI0035D61F4B
MSTTALDTPIATRVLATPDGPVTVVFGRPYPRPDDPRITLCPCRIGDRPVNLVPGLDDIHAFLTAVRLVGAVLGLPADWPVTQPSAA